MTITTRLLTAAAAASLALTAAAPASAETQGSHGAELPKSAKVLNAPAKRLSLKQAAALRARARRTGRFPSPPRLKVDRRKLDRVETSRHDMPAHDDHSVSRAGGDERLFGNESAYATKRDPILNAIHTFNAIHVPRNGGRYLAPRLYELNHGAPVPGCTGGTYNGGYCGMSNSIGWSMTWTAEAFRTSGDMKWATLLAHEYGHGAQGYLNIKGGWMGYTQYSEGFADCMAGAFLFHAHHYRMTDAVGRGDYNEFRDAFASLASPTTQLNNHGDFQWRYALATYGWNTGFDGCTRWARSIDGV